MGQIGGPAIHYFHQLPATLYSMAEEEEDRRRVSWDAEWCTVVQQLAGAHANTYKSLRGYPWMILSLNLAFHSSAFALVVLLCDILQATPV